MPSNCPVHFFDGDRLLASATKDAFEFLDGSRRRDNRELPLPNVNEFDSVSSFDTQFSADFRWNRDLSF